MWRTARRVKGRRIPVSVALNCHEQLGRVVRPATHPRGQPVIPNGMAVCKLHHVAFDQNIIGVRWDLVIEVSETRSSRRSTGMLVHGPRVIPDQRIRTTHRDAGGYQFISAKSRDNGGAALAAPHSEIRRFVLQSSSDHLRNDGRKGHFAAYLRRQKDRILYTRSVVKIVPFSEARSNLTELLDDVEDRHEHVLITRNGRPAAVMLSADEYESLEETLEILEDEELLKALKRSDEDVKADRLSSLAEVRRGHS